MSLDVVSVSKRFAGVTALAEVSMSIQPGEVLGLIGPNGSGKSTLVNVITGILRPDSGSVTVDGREVTGSAPSTIANAGVARTFQTVRLFAGLSVEDNVAAVIKDREVDQITIEHLRHVGLDHLATSQAGHLPYGLQRRLEIARALVTKPRYLLLDEPAAGLNHVESRNLEGTIRSIPAEPRWGCGILVIDHDLRLITSLCDRILVLGNGRVIVEGTPEEVRRHPEVIEAYVGRRTGTTG